MKDLRLTLRALWRQPTYTLTAVLSLALGIGANTAIFSLFDQALLRPLPVRDPGGLVLLYQPGPLEGTSSTDEAGGPSFSYPLFRGLQEHQTPFTGLAGARATTANLFYQGEALSGVAHRVSGNYFAVLGVRAAIGRLIDEADDRTPGARPVAVLSYRYWTSRWGADPSVLNRKIGVNGHPMTIVGVAEKHFDGERRGTSVDVFVPITMNREITPGWNGFEDRRDHWVTLFARLKPNMTPAAAASAVNVAYREQLEEDIARLGGRSEASLQEYRAKRIVLTPGGWGRGAMREQARLPLFVLLGMTLLVLLMACANVTSLQLARGAARRHEVAVRLALGASRLRLMRQLSMESVALAAAAAVLGLGAAQWTLHTLLPAVPVGDPELLSAAIDARILAFCLVLTVSATVLFGLFPALQASRPDLVAFLKAHAGDTDSGLRRALFRRSLATAQVAVSLLLLVCAGLFARTFVALIHLDLGIQPEHLITFSIDPKLDRYTDAQALALYDELSDRLAALPGVVLTSAARVPAMGGSASGGSVTVEGFTPSDGDASESSFNVVGPGYFRTMGTPLVVGRELTREDEMGAPKVAVVNEAFVRHFLAGRDPLGRHFGFGLGRRVQLDTEIVGVVRDAKYSSVRETPSPVFYVAYRQATQQRGLHFYVRTSADPEAVAPLVRRAVSTLAPTVPVRDLKTMRQQIDENVGSERLLSTLTVSFASIATLLAAIGLYGVLAYDVSRRTREIGIRMALGARLAQVRGLVMRQVGLTLLIGTAIGLGAAAAAGKVLQATLFGATPWDPLVYGSALGVLVLMAFAAAYVPARRASRVDPMAALRDE